MGRSVTMSQIAQELNLSRLTVSSVLNNNFKDRGISIATAERVRSYSQERGYVPSRQALDLRNGVRNSIGVLHCGRFYSHVTDAFNRMVDSINEGPSRLEVMVVNSRDISQGLQELIARGISKLLWIHTRVASQELAESGALLPYLGRVKTIIYNFRFGDSHWKESLIARKIHLVGVDRHSGFKRLGSVLARLGHRRILIASNEEGAHETQAADSFRETGLDIQYAFPDEYKILHSSPKVTSFIADRAIETMRRSGVTACCFLDDEQAGFCMAELIGRGVRIPEDLTITGYDGIPCSAFTPVPLTTLAVPVEPMVQCVEQLLKKEDRTFEHCFDLQLIRRSSHGPAHKS